MKKFVNDPVNFVQDMMRGLYLANKDKLDWIPEHNIIKRKEIPTFKVPIIQGSGSGHEPAHAMSVGMGMLDAACPGNVFAAPSVDGIVECTKRVNNGNGILFLVNNYQGDRMAWDMAREFAEAEGIKIGMVVVDDDVSVQNSTHTVGRRGVAGNFFVIKACGAASEKGVKLGELVALGNKVNQNVRTMGVALSSCTPPAKGSTIFEMDEDEMEVGVGIHGELGRRRDKIKTADEIVGELFKAVTEDLPFEKGMKIALMINGLGATPINELYLLYGIAAQKCEEAGLEIRKNYVGNYCTALDMNGFSLSMLRLDDELEELLNEEAETPMRVF